MNIKQALSAIFASTLGFTGFANAETYQGVHDVRSMRARSDVAAEARAVDNRLHSGEASFSDNIPVRVSRFTRAEINRAAGAITHAGNPYGDYAGAGVLRLKGGISIHDIAQTQAQEISR